MWLRRILITSTPSPCSGYGSRKCTVPENLKGQSAENEIGTSKRLTRRPALKTWLARFSAWAGGLIALTAADLALACWDKRP